MANASLSLAGVDAHGSAEMILTCELCGYAGPPMRRVAHNRSRDSVLSLWETGIIKCPCGLAGDHLEVVAAPAGMKPHTLAEWSWHTLHPETYYD